MESHVILVLGIPLQRYETPQGTILPPLVRHKSIDNKRNITEDTTTFMDFQATKESLRASSTSGPTPKKLTPFVDTQKKQERKAQEAAEYRAKILKQQQQAKQKGDMSPSFGKEKAAIKASKQGQMDREHRQRNIDGKATSAQCAFNLANILMVRWPPTLFVDGRDNNNVHTKRVVLTTIEKRVLDY